MFIPILLSLAMVASATTKCEYFYRGNFMSPSFSAVSEKEILKKVRETYKYLLYQLRYDKNIQIHQTKVPMKDAFNSDIEVIVHTHSGGCRQISHKLIHDLELNGVKSQLLILGTATGSHAAVLYEVDGQQYVADLTAEITYCTRNSEVCKDQAPILYKLPIEYYKTVMYPDAKGFVVFNPHNLEFKYI